MLRARKQAFDILAIGRKSAIKTGVTVEPVKGDDT
jgi:hypothetical protein